MLHKCVAPPCFTLARELGSLAQNSHVHGAACARKLLRDDCCCEVVGMQQAASGLDQSLLQLLVTGCKLLVRASATGVT